MINVVGRSANLAPYLKVSTQIVSSTLKPLAAVTPSEAKKIVNDETSPSTLRSLTKNLPRGITSVKSGPVGNYIA